MSDFKSFHEFQEEQHHLPPGGVEEGKNFAAPHGGMEEAPPAQRRRFPKFRMYAAGGGAVLLLVGLVLLCFPVPFGELRMHGNASMTMEDILFDGAVRQPVNVLQISTSDLAWRLSQDVRVASVDVRRSSPVAIDVTLTERTAAAVVQEQFGYAFLDGNGMVIRTVSSIRKLEIPIITGVKLDNALLGEVTGREPVQTALRFVSHLSPQGLGIFSEVNVGNPDHIVAYTRDGLPVRLGNGDRMEERAMLAENMVSDVKTRRLSVEYIDASLTSPYIKLKK